MKVTFIATVFNEEGTIGDFLRSIIRQSVLPNEIIIVDGGSRDRTVANIKYKILNIKKKKRFKHIKFEIIIKPGNRAVGRNEAIKNSSNEIIVCSDAGCILDKNWVKNIIEPFNDSRVDVIAGYYKGLSSTIFEKCLIPYVLVMPDKVNNNNFLPASRSMAFRKSIWKKIGGFSEKYSHNEDYVFAQKLKNAGIKIFFRKDAIVYWKPRRNIMEAFIMFFRFAYGDAEAGILRQKVILIFARYFLGFYLLFLSFIERSLIPAYGLVLGLSIYVVWSIKKNYKYIKNVKAFFFLPLLQFVSDFAVILGTVFGLFKKINFFSVYRLIKTNKVVATIIGLYVLLMLSIIDWGIPNINHPFNYQMDEWHQMQSVRAVFTQGSPNIEGSANGSMFHFLLAGVWLIPFILFGIINPFAIKSSIDFLEIQTRLFEVLRFNTLFFGVMSVILIAYVAKKYFNLNTIIVTFLFVVNPIWLSLSNYFKYDIALIFWIILGFLLLLRYMTKPTLFNYCLAAFISGIALSVKISAIPMILILITAFILFNRSEKREISHLISGVLIFFSTFLFFGIPDLLLGKGDIKEYLYDNLVRAPEYSSNYILGMNYIVFLITKSVSTVFGYFLYGAFVLGLIFILSGAFMRKVRTDKKYIFLLITLLIFIISLYPLKIEARGNRLLVLLPFIVIISGFFIEKTISYSHKYIKKIIIGIVFIGLLFQSVESFSWVYIKYLTDPRQESSRLMKSTILRESSIGIENIPIYQSLPDLVLKEFYEKQEYLDRQTQFRYEIVSNHSVSLPEYVLVTNGEIVQKLFKQSPKNDLLKELAASKHENVFSVKLDISVLGLFRDERDYFMSGLHQAPLSIALYKNSMRKAQ